MIRFLRKRQVHTAPVCPGTELFGWQSYSTTIWRAFFADIHSFGWKVALYNLAWQWRHR